MKSIDVEDYVDWVEDAVKQIQGTDEEMRKELIRLAAQIIADLKMK